MLKCIIVDDQTQAVQSLKNHIRKISFLECTGSFSDPKDALVFLKTKPADLVFFSLRKSFQADNAQVRILQLHAMVILISSTKNHAYEAFENNVTDFLLKPVLFERLYQAAEKAYKIKFSPDGLKPNVDSAPVKGGFIFLLRNPPGLSAWNWMTFIM